jgi:hypothetical protein
MNGDFHAPAALSMKPLDEKMSIDMIAKKIEPTASHCGLTNLLYKTTQ